MKIPIDAYLAFKPEENAKAFVTSAEVGRKAYLDAAYRLIALTQQVGEEKATAMVRKLGATQSTIQNARYVVRVYEGLVVPGHVTQEWFAEVQYTEAYAIARALGKVTAAKMAACGSLKRSAKSAYGDFELMAETGLTRPEREAAAEVAETKKVAAAKKVVEAAAAKTPEATAAPAAVVTPEATAPAVVAPVKGAKSLTELAPTTAEKPSPDPVVIPVAAKPAASPMADLEDKIGQLEKLAVGIVSKLGDEVTCGRIQELLVHLNRAVATAIEAKTKAMKAKKVG